MAWLLYLKYQLEKACEEEIQTYKKVKELVYKYKYIR